MNSTVRAGSGEGHTVVKSLGFRTHWLLECKLPPGREDVASNQLCLPHLVPPTLLAHPKLLIHTLVMELRNQ